MGKKNKKRTAGAVCKKEITLDKCINQINLAVVKLNRLERAGSDLRVRRISTSIASGLENGLKCVVSEEQRRSLMEAFGCAVLRLHEVIGAKVEGWILCHVENRGYTQPLTHDAKYKGHWDGVRGSWDDPKFDVDKKLCKAERWLYVPWVYSLAVCLVSVVGKAMEIDRSNLVRMYKLMACTFRQLAMALRKEDPYKFRPHWLTLPIDSYSCYSLGETLDTMQRTTRYAVHTNWDRAITIIPNKFRQCTYEFCLGMNFEVCMIPQLVEGYAGMLEQFELRARSLADDIHAPVRRP